MRLPDWAMVEGIPDPVLITTLLLTIIIVIAMIWEIHNGK